MGYTQSANGKFRKDNGKTPQWTPPTDKGKGPLVNADKTAVIHKEDKKPTEQPQTIDSEQLKKNQQVLAKLAKDGIPSDRERLKIYGDALQDAGIAQFKLDNNKFHLRGTAFPFPKAASHLGHDKNGKSEVKKDVIQRKLTNFHETTFLSHNMLPNGSILEQVVSGVQEFKKDVKKATEGVKEGLKDLKEGVKQKVKKDKKDKKIAEDAPSSQDKKKEDSDGKD